MATRRITFSGSSHHVGVVALDDDIEVTAIVPLSKLGVGAGTQEETAKTLALYLAFAISPDLLDVTTDSSDHIVIHPTFSSALPGVDKPTLRTAIRDQVH
jgi:hypothetical protein